MFMSVTFGSDDCLMSMMFVNRSVLRIKVFTEYLKEIHSSAVGPRFVVNCAVLLTVLLTNWSGWAKHCCNNSLHIKLIHLLFVDVKYSRQRKVNIQA